MKVDPIKRLKDVRSIKRLLAHSPRDSALFVIGINTNLRASDILNLTFEQVEHIQFGGEVEIKEKKTGKKRISPERLRDMTVKLSRSEQKRRVKQLEKLVGAYPEFALAFNDLGVLYYQEGHKQQAVKNYEKTIYISAVIAGVPGCTGECAAG